MKRNAGCLACVHQLQLTKPLFSSAFFAAPDGIFEAGKKYMKTDSQSSQLQQHIRIKELYQGKLKASYALPSLKICRKHRGFVDNFIEFCIYREYLLIPLSYIAGVIVFGRDKPLFFCDGDLNNFLNCLKYACNLLQCSCSRVLIRSPLFYAKKHSCTNQCRKNHGQPEGENKKFIVPENCPITLWKKK